MDYTVINYENTKSNINRYGDNILSGITPVVSDGDGRRILPMWNYDIDCITQANIYRHVDLRGKLPITLKFDLGESVLFNAAVIGGFYAPRTDFCIAEYELYSAQNDVSLFDACNRILTYCNDGMWKSEGEAAREGISQDSARGAIQSFEFSEELSARYFGVKILRGCEFDDIVRLGKIQIHGALYCRQRSFVRQYGNNMIAGQLPYISVQGRDFKSNMWPDAGLQEYLTDGIAADAEKSVRYAPKDGTARIVYKLFENSIDTVIVSGKLSDTEVSVFLSENELDLFHAAPVKGSRVKVTDTAEAFLFDIQDRTRFKNLGLEFNLKGAADSFELDEIACCTLSDTVRVHQKDVINDNYKGNGVNLVPFTTMPGNIAAGYNDAYWQEDYKRIITVKPAIARVWVQADWFEPQKGVYDFDTPEIKGLYQYLSAFRDSGTAVELTYSWKAGKKIQSWYSISGVAEPFNSAPADLDDFAESCSVLMQRLWEDGFDNVKYISFANEPGGTWDFLCTGDTKEYYCRTVRRVHQRFVRDGIRDKLEIWGPESANDYNWIRLCVDELSDCIDMYTLHTYETLSDRIRKNVENVRNFGAEHFMITEFGEQSDSDNSFDMGYAGYVINGANAGFDGLLVWTLCGVKSMSVSSPDGWTMGEPMHLWNPQLNGGMPNYSYYSMGLLMRYIPSGSRVVRCDNTDKGIRTAVFITSEGEYTVVAECSPIAEKRRLRIVFDEEVNQTFYKHIYAPGRNTLPEGNALLPQTVAEFFCESEFIDENVENGYCVIIYSTLKPPVQVKINPPRVNTVLGKCVKLSAELIDGGKAVEYSVVSGGGTVSDDGVYTPDINAKTGDVSAVRATDTDSGAYGICLIRIL